MSTQTTSAVPAVPLYALAAIPDENTRIVLQSIIDGWEVRNAAAGDGRNAFVTRGDLTTITGASQSNGRLGIFPTFADLAKTFTGGATPGAVVADIEASLQESLLFQQLGTSVALLNQNLTAEQQARVAAVQAVADNLAAETLARTGLGTTLGGQIATLQNTSDEQATLITALGTWKVGAQSSITSLQDTTSTQAQTLTQLTTRITGAESSITSLNTTTGNQAQTLASLSTRVGDTESAIATLNTTTGNQANTLTTITASLGQKANTYFQATAPTGTIAEGSLWFDSDDNNKPYRWNGTGWTSVESPVSLAGVTAAITAEQDARVSADNAITESVNAQFTSVNGSIASLNNKTTTLTTTFSALANYMVDLTAQFDATQAAVQQEAEARADADGTLFARYSVKTDVNGYVSGYGLMSTANNSTPTSEFIVRADKFAIGSPSGPGITPRIPFTVLTTADAQGNQPGVYMDNVVIKMASISGAYIADLAVDTIKIADNAVIIPDYAESYATLAQLQPQQGVYTYEYRWDDDNTLVTQAQMDTIRSKTGPAVHSWLQTNPAIRTSSRPTAILANFAARNYLGQPVLIMYDWDIRVSTTFPFYLRIVRVEAVGGRDPVPDSYTVARIPRDWLQYGTDAGQLSEAVDVNGVRLDSHEVYVVAEWSFQPGTNVSLVKSGFIYDSPSVANDWSYALILVAFVDDATTVSALSGKTKLVTMGLKK